MNKQQLIVEYNKNSSFVITEGQSDVPSGMMRCEGVFAVTDIVNNNNRFYPKEEYRKHIINLNGVIKEGGLFGESEHPNSMNVDLNNVSHKIESLYLDENTNEVRGNILLLDNTKGKNLQSVVRAGGTLKMSSRGTGHVDESGRVTLDQMVTFDAVGTPGFSQSGFRKISECADVDVYVSESLDTKKSFTKVEVEALVESKLSKYSREVSFLKEELSNVKSSISDSVKEQVTEAIKYSDNSNLLDESKIIDAITEKLTKDVTTFFDNDKSTEALTEEDVIDIATNVITENIVPAIEKWVTIDVVETISEGVQEWVAKDVAGKIESWVTEDVADMIESWITEDVMKTISEGVETWATNDLAESIEGWIKSHVVKDLAEGIEEWTKTDLVESLKNDVVKQVQDDVIKEHKSKMPTGSKQLLESFEYIKKNSDYRTKEQKEQGVIIENINADEAPAFVKFIPESYKYIYNGMTNEQKETVAKLADLKDIVDESSALTFWTSVNISEMVKPQRTTNIKDNTIVESQIDNVVRLTKGLNPYKN